MRGAPDSLFPALSRAEIKWLRDEIQPREKGYKSDEFWPPALFLSPQETAEKVGALLDEVARLRQGLWDVATLTGFDTDGDETPDHMTYPDIVDLALREVERLREDYDNATERRGPDA